MDTYDVNGNFINPDLLYYRYWIENNGERSVFVLNSDEYAGLEKLGLESLELIPYRISLDDKDNHEVLYPGGTIFCICGIAPDKVGLQSMSKAGGEVNYSAICWYDTVTGEITISSGETGIDTPNAATASVDAIYGIDGLRRAEMGKGLNIVKMTDGRTVKVVVK